MKLLTHNMLASHVKGVTDNYPLKIEVEKVSNFLRRFISVGHPDQPPHLIIPLINPG